MALNRPRTFVSIFSKSLTSLTYYKKILNAPPSFSVKYYFILMFLSTLITSAVLTTHLTPQVRTKTQILINDLGEIYPPNLEIKIQNGQLLLNQPQPYVLPLPASIQQSVQPEIKNLAVFDTDGTINDLKLYQTLLLINSVNVLVQMPTDIDVYPLAQLPDTVINYDSVKKQVTQLNIMIHYIGALIFGLTMLILLFYNFVVRSLYLVLTAFSLYLIAKMRGFDVTFNQLYQIGLHTATFPVVVDLICVIILGTLLPSFWFFMTSLVLGNIVVHGIEFVEDE